MKETKVLAVVNNKEITENDVNFLLRNMDPQRASQFNSEEGKKHILQELINQELFYFEALENGLDQDEAFKTELEKMKSSLLKQYAISKALSTIIVEEEEIQEYYNQNKERFTTSESVSASHILVDSKEKADEVIREINGGLAFEEAAAKYSSCPSNANGGDLGYFTKGRMVPEFEQAAFDMQIGSISDPVQTQFGFHIIKLTGHKEAGLKDLSEVKGELKHQLTDVKQNDAYFNKVNELKKKYEVVVK